VRTSGHQQFSHKGPVKTKFCLFVFVLWGFDLSFCRQLITEVIAPFWLILVATVGRPHNTQAAQAVCLDSLSLSPPLQRTQSFFNHLVPSCLQCAIATTSYEYRSSRSCVQNTTYCTHVHSICAHNTLPLLCSALLCSARGDSPPRPPHNSSSSRRRRRRRRLCKIVAQELL